MTAKEKAVSMAANHAARFWEFAYELDIKPTPLQVRVKAKQCALIAVDEYLSFQENLYITEGSIAYQYWLDVKKEIELL